MKLSPKVQQRKAKIKAAAGQTFWQRYHSADPAVKPQERSPAHARPTKPVVPPLQLSQVDKIRESIQVKNSQLYSLQLSLLRTNWDDDVVHKPVERPAELTARCDALEAEIARLCDDMKTARVLSDRQPDSEAQSKWFQQQQSRTASLRQNVEGVTDATPRSMKESMAAEAARMEQRAESMVRGLRASLARGDYDQFVNWQQVQTKELQELESQLARARASGHGIDAVVAKLEACHADLEDMVQHCASSDASSSSCDSDTDSELDYEVLEELREGDTVKLVCDDEDGFKRGEEAIVVEVDQSIAYPYRLKAVGHSANGFFKACDVELVRRRHGAPAVVPSPGPVTSPVSFLYGKRPTSPYAAPPCREEMVVDIEKGRCRTLREETDEPFNSMRRIALTLNPLASGG